MLEPNQPFQQLVDIVTGAEGIKAFGLWGNTRREINLETLEDFQRQWILDALKGWRYGQSFSEFFGITNASPLYWFNDVAICQRWIKTNYFNGKLDWPKHMVVNDR